MKKEPRPRLTDDFFVAPKFHTAVDIRENVTFVSAPAPTSKLRIFLSGVAVIAAMAGAFYTTYAHAADVKIIHVTRFTETVPHVKIDRHPSIEVEAKVIVRHPSVVKLPVAEKVRTPSMNQNAVRKFPG